MNKASAAYVAADVNHQAYEEERDAHLVTKEELAAALSTIAAINTLSQRGLEDEWHRRSQYLTRIGKVARGSKR